MLPFEQFHPILLHFPIVLIVLAAGIDIVAYLRGVPLHGPGTYANFSLATVVLAGVLAVVTAMLGDLALEIAVDRGTSPGLLEGHEELGMITAWLIAGWAALRLLARWRALPVEASRVAAVAAVEVVLVGLILATAYLGGSLVYEHGVNVAAAIQG